MSIHLAWTFDQPLRLALRRPVRPSFRLATLQLWAARAAHLGLAGSVFVYLTLSSLLCGWWCDWLHLVATTPTTSHQSHHASSGPSSSSPAPSNPTAPQPNALCQIQAPNLANFVWPQSGEQPTLPLLFAWLALTAAIILFVGQPLTPVRITLRPAVQPPRRSS